MKKLLALMLGACMVLALTACSSGGNASSGSSSGADSLPASSSGEVTAFDAGDQSVLKTGVLRVGMECAYAPYNWTQSDDQNGAVPIYESTDYANGYDVQMAKKICEANGWTLEVHKMDWDSIPMAVQSGAIDCGICGQSITQERLSTMDFSDPYYFASIVVLTKKDGKYASAAGLSALSGAACTSQINTVWYDKMLPQIENATILAAQETAPAMLVSLESGACDLVVTDQPTALAACVAYPDLVMLDFTGSDDNFTFDESDVNIGISIMKGNSELVEKCNSVLSQMTADDFTALMNDMISVQPLSE